VEDEGIVAEEVRDTLTRLGYDVPVVAATAEKALKGVLQTEVDLVLMDIRLRGSMDGIEAAQRIRDSVRIPVVFLTAYSDEATLRRAKIGRASCRERVYRLV